MPKTVEVVSNDEGICTVDAIVGEDCQKSFVEVRKISLYMLAMSVSSIGPSLARLVFFGDTSDVLL